MSKIPKIDATLMGYWIAVQDRTMIRSVMCNLILGMVENILSRVIMMSCVVLLRAHLRSARSIAIIGSVRGIFDGLGDSLWRFWLSM